MGPRKIKVSEALKINFGFLLRSSNSQYLANYTCTVHEI